MDDSSSIVSFILDDKIVNIDFSKDKTYSPTTTVLRYLRSLENHKGVKEGCSIGDCGACTVVIGELFNQKILYKAVPSCLVFLPYLHGKQLITIENLSYKENNNLILHPVQKSMLEYHGTQCGFCTTGIIMSIFALYKNTDRADINKIQDALSGNLCRCTGYKPIIEAAENACENKTEDSFSLKEKDTINMLTEINQSKKNLVLSSYGKNYFKPFELKQTLKLRAEHPEAKLVGGATDLSPQMNRFKEEYSKIIDISDVSELKFFHQDGQYCYIGAGTTLEELIKLQCPMLPALTDILKVFGSVQIRNLATIGGNIATASPIGDLLPLFYIYDAMIEVRRMDHIRAIKIQDFITGYRQTDLKPDEIICQLVVPKVDENTKIKAYKIAKRNDLDISTTSAAFKLKINPHKDVSEIKIVYGGMDKVLRRASLTEDFIKGKGWSRETIDEAMEILAKEFNPISDVRAGDEYRRTVAKNLLLKFWNESQ